MNDFVMSALEQLWSFIAVALVIYRLGVVSKAVAKRRGWHRAGGFYDVTLRAHPVVAGMMAGLLPLPTLHAIDALHGAQLVVTRCGWFMLAGALCGQVYEGVKYAFQWARNRAGVAADAVPVTESDPGGEA